MATVLPIFRVIVAGGRDFNDYNLLCDRCDKLLSQKQLTHNIVIVSGTCRGADTLGEQYAHERGYNDERFPADWKNLGKVAGVIRNNQMADNADALIAFWDGQSRGTKNMINIAHKKNLLVRIIKYN